MLAQVFVGLTHLTGLADEESQILRVTSDAIDLRALLVAAIVIGALGVLDDVTVTQVSTVIGSAPGPSPTHPGGISIGQAIRIGRDHIASTVNTLVLAYAGASLPLLLVFVESDRPVEPGDRRARSWPSRSCGPWWAASGWSWPCR